MYHEVEVLTWRRTTPMGDDGTVINVVSWLLALVAICVLTARLTMRHLIKDKTRRFGLDDVFIFMAFLFSIGQTIAVSVESIQALGQQTDTLRANQVAMVQKAQYAACILYIANMGCARISLCILIMNILPGSTARITAITFATFTALWTVSGVLVALFACSLPSPWRSQDDATCINALSWVNYVGSTNIIVEILLISIPLCIWNVRTSARRRTSISLLFLSRLSIVGAIGAQLHFFNARETNDLNHAYWRTILCVQIAQNLSVITACLPGLHPFIARTLAGAIRQQDMNKFVCTEKSKILTYFSSRKGFDPVSSQSSSMPVNRELTEEYCAPLATYGLDRASTLPVSPQPNSFPARIATPVMSLDPPENVFMRSVEIPSVTRQSSVRSIASSKSMRHPYPNQYSGIIPQVPEIPKSLAEVGVLPFIDFDADDCETSKESGTNKSKSRRPPSEYVFNRSKVISVPEESYLREQGEGDQYYKKYYPPLPSPKAPKRPPRAF